MGLHPFYMVLRDIKGFLIHVGVFDIGGWCTLGRKPTLPLSGGPVVSYKLIFDLFVHLYFVLCK